MQRENRLDPETVNQTVPDHSQTDPFGYPRKLEVESDHPVEISVRGQIARRPEQHRGETVLAASAQAACSPFSAGQLCSLTHWQRIHISPQGPPELPCEK